MAEKLAVATLVTGPQWQHLAALTMPSQRWYAERLGADFIVLGERVYPQPHYDKWQLVDLLAAYDRVIYLDADVIVRPDCPDLFACVPPECVGGENALLSEPRHAAHLMRSSQRLGLGPLPCPFYLNSGVLVVSSGHRPLFRQAEALLTEGPWPEQDHLNIRLIQEKFPICFLPSGYNDRLRRGDYLRCSFILHYAHMAIPERLQAIQRDLASWNTLCRHRPGRILTAPAGGQRPQPDGTPGGPLPVRGDEQQSFFEALIKHTHNFGALTWLGHPIWQNILDLWTIQETLAQVKPALLIECGTNRGGSALYYAHLFDLLGAGRVLTIDVLKLHELSHARIRFIQGSSIAPDVLQQVHAEAAAAAGPILVILDSDHSKAHVSREMEAYAGFVTPGSFMLVQDGVIDVLPMCRDDRPGPLGAIHDFLSRHDEEFAVDHERCQRFLITHHPLGWLRRKEKRP